MRVQMEWLAIEFKMFFRNFVCLFFTLIFPPLFMILFGEIYGNDPAEMFGGAGTVDASTPAYICMVICVTGIMSLPISLAGYREKKVLKRFKATTISPIMIIAAQLVVNAVMTVAGAALLLLIAVVRYKMVFAGSPGQVIVAFLISVFSIFAIGFLIGSLINNSRTVMAVSNVVYFPMLFLSGATIPMEVMPDTIKSVSRFIPLTRAVNIMKAAWIDGTLWSHTTDMLILLAIGVVFTAVSCAAFRWE